MGPAAINALAFWTAAFWLLGFAVNRIIYLLSAER